jgi:dTDP-4-amino-4,6-dideoxygalactose transaminase
MFTYLSKSFGGISRDQFVKYLCDAGIPAIRSYRPLYQTPVFQKIPKSSWGVTKNYWYIFLHHGSNLIK